MLLCALIWAGLPLPSAGQQKTLSKLNDKIGATRDKIGRKKGTEHVLASDIASYTRRIDHLQVRISGLERRETVLQADLDRKQAELAEIQAQLRAERARLARLRARLAVARRALARRLVELYRSDQPDLMTVVMNSDGFAELLERGEFLRRISDSDRKIVTIVRSAKRDATESAQRLGELERRQRAVAAAILARRNEVRMVRDDLIGTRVGYANTRADKQHALVKVRSERENLEGHLTALVSAQRRIQAKLAAVAQQQGGSTRSLPAGPIKRGSGQLIWPVNGPITSPFCERRAWEACHPGIDIGAGTGTPIRAAAGGKVVLVQGEGSSGGYGNFTCIQHTASMSTCYAHQSSIGVSVGQSVSQGQVIGAVGCTGHCFGPHLHFEVRINGAVTNPMNYL
ncbi:MAG TPA: peptidoglycan DD-metalloendopeptidase family protein [Solirubrobacteraceae bacterium]